MFFSHVGEEKAKGNEETSLVLGKAGKVEERDRTVP